MLQDALQDGFCNGVVSSVVSLLPTRVLAFQQGSLLVVSHIRLSCVRSILNAEESPEAFRFKCLNASLCLCSQSPALVSVEEDGDSKCLSLVLKLMFLLFQMVLSIEVADMATAILILIY